MEARKHSNSLRLTKILTVIFLFLLVVHLVLQYINTVYLDSTFGPFYELTNRFDFDDELSIPTWYAQFLFLLVSGCSFLLAYLERYKATKIFWLLLATAALIGSIDEVSAIHESVLQVLHLMFFDIDTPTLQANAWLFVAPVVILALLVFLYKIAKHLPTKTVLLLASSTGIYIIGAIGVDIASSAVVESTPFIEQGVMVALEESLEIVGLILLFYTITSYTEENYRQQILKSLQALSTKANR